MSDNYAVRSSILLNSDIDIIGIAETHLTHDKGAINLPGYIWYGHNRDNIHRHAKVGSGGVGFFVKKCILELFDVIVEDKTYEGILWLRLQEKHGNGKIHVCVCYLPPENSTRNIEVHEFFNTLTSQIYTYQDMSTVYICGDFNARTSNIDDYIAGVDNIPVRSDIDKKSNRYGEFFCDFLSSVNYCMLNGRCGTQNDFTYVSPLGTSVVDYCIVPYEDIGKFTNFRVDRMSSLLTKYALQSYVGPGSCIPDHSLLVWEVHCPALLRNPVRKTAVNQKCVSSDNRKLYQLDHINNSFLRDCNDVLLLQEHIDNVERTGVDQSQVNDIFTNFVDIVKKEMDDKIPHRVIKVSHGYCNKKRRVNKPWWNENLSFMWNDMCKAEKEWKKSNSGNKRELHTIYVNKRKIFDKFVQRAKRQYWFVKQREIQNLCDGTDSRLFWKEISNLGVGKERRKQVPLEVVQEDGTVSSDQNIVLSKWKTDFCSLLNPAHDDNVGVIPPNMLDINGYTDDLFYNDITLDEVYIAMRDARNGKAAGYDELPVEVLKNESAAIVLARLFNVCFKYGIIPDVWKKGIICPVPKSSTADPRDPLSYRGITLAPSSYKLYCSVLNKRLCAWEEDNNVLHDIHKKPLKTVWPDCKVATKFEKIK